MKWKESEELQSRREFFKKAAERSLPILVGITMPNVLLSCGGDNELDPNNPGSGSGKEDGVSFASGKIDGYEYVDLGLSVKWARYNIGATKPESYGTYLYSHTLCTDSHCFDKLVNAGYWGDRKSTSGTIYDMARSKWGSKWRMPTRNDFKELINNCAITKINYNNCTGFLFTSKKNGNSIFFAAAGSKWRYKGVWDDMNIGSMGYYWSGDVSIGSSISNSYSLRCGHDSSTGKVSTSVYDEDMYDNKFTIRPVSSSNGTSTGCNGTCSAACADNASGGCSGCSSSCSSGCKNTCSYICSKTCSNNCYGRCSTSCGGSCSYVSAGNGCSGCASSCYNQCYTGCDHACYGACMSQCISSSK